MVGSFKSVTGIGNKQDVIEFKLGGDKSVRRKPGRVTFNNIVLERGYTATDDLWDWRKAIEEGKIDRRSGAIIILDHDGSQNLPQGEVSPDRGPSLAMESLVRKGV